MKKKTPTAINGKGLELLAGCFHPFPSATAYQVQHLSHRLGLPPAHAAALAPMIYGGTHHG